VAPPTYISDYPSKLGGTFYVVRIVKQMGAGLEVRKTTARVGAGGGRVAGARLHGTRNSPADTDAGVEAADGGSGGGFDAEFKAALDGGSSLDTDADADARLES
jgi:hypothetical protein